MLHRPEADSPLGTPGVVLAQPPVAVFCAEVGALEAPLNDEYFHWSAGLRPGALY